jgi:hypothetical protein
MSASTQAIVTLIQQRLLSFTPSTSIALTTRLGGRLYYDQAPAAGSVSPTYPYATYRLTNRIESEGYGGMRETGDVELLFYGRPRGTQLWTLEGCADVADEALLDWNDVTAGIAFSRFRVRDLLPMPLDGMDRDLVTVRCLYPVVLWPTYRTTHA